MLKVLLTSFPTVLYRSIKSSRAKEPRASLSRFQIYPGEHQSSTVRDPPGQIPCTQAPYDRTRFRHPNTRSHFLIDIFISKQERSGLGTGPISASPSSSHTSFASRFLLFITCYLFDRGHPCNNSVTNILSQHAVQVSVQRSVSAFGMRLPSLLVTATSFPSFT